MGLALLSPAGGKGFDGCLVSPPTGGVVLLTRLVGRNLL